LDNQVHSGAGMTGEGWVLEETSAYCQEEKFFIIYVKATAN